MKLNLTRPLVVFDLETTGLDIVRDRIFQLSYIKVYPDGKEVSVHSAVCISKFIASDNEVKRVWSSIVDSVNH